MNGFLRLGVERVGIDGKRVPRLGFGITMDPLAGRAEGAPERGIAPPFIGRHAGNQPAERLKIADQRLE